MRAIRALWGGRVLGVGHGIYFGLFRHSGNMRSKGCEKPRFKTVQDSPSTWQIKNKLITTLHT